MSSHICTCTYPHVCMNTHVFTCMNVYVCTHTYSETGGGTAGGERGREEVHLSASALEQLNRGGCGSQAAFESPGSELGTAVVEKLMLEIQSLLLGCGSKAGHERSRCSLIQSKLKSSLPWQTQPFPLRQTEANQCYFSGSAQLRRECHCVQGRS